MSSITQHFLAEPSTAKYGGELLEVQARPAYAGQKTTQCVIVFVSVDAQGKPMSISGWNPETPGEVVPVTKVRAQREASRAHHH